MHQAAAGLAAPPGTGARLANYGEQQVRPGDDGRPALRGHTCLERLNNNPEKNLAEVQKDKSIFCPYFVRKYDFCI